MRFGARFSANVSSVSLTLAAALLLGSGPMANAQTLKDAHSPHGPSGTVAADTSVFVEPTTNRAIPRYLSTPIAPADAELLRKAYGIEDPSRLYVSDSTDGGTLKYDTQRKTCSGCLVNSYHVGYVSVREPGESWEEVERRVKLAKARTFTGGAHPASESLAALDPDVRPLAEAMLRDAKDAGFKFHVIATYRSPLRQAFLMSKGRGRTHTLTSNHSYGRALDIVIDNGNRGNKRTKRDWIAFRRWVTGYKTPTGESFHILGRPDDAWDWPHVELPSSTLGFHSVDEAIARAKECLAPQSSVPCDFQPHLPFDAPSPLVPQAAQARQHTEK